MKKTMILVGNKCDSEKREVSIEEGKQMAEKLQVPFYLFMKLVLKLKKMWK